MISCEPTQFCKIPLKSCQDSVIDHKLVTIKFNVEWPNRGDDPNLIVQITNKIPSPTFIEQNHPLPTMCINSTTSIPQEPQYQDTLPSSCPPPYYHPQSSAINFHNSVNLTTPMSNISNRNEFISSTTTELFGNMQMPSQNVTSSTIIQPVTNTSKSQLLPNVEYQTIANQQYSLHQHVIHTPCSSSMNDSQINIQMTAISPLSTRKQSPSLTTNANIAQGPIVSGTTSSSANSLTKLIICKCANPTKVHEDNCPVCDLHKKPSSTILTTETIYRPGAGNNQMIAHRTAFSSQVRSNDSISPVSIVEPMESSKLLPFPTPDLVTKMNLSSNVTTIISQQTPVTTIKAPVLNFENHAQQQKLNILQNFLTNSENYQTTSSIPMQTEGQQNRSQLNLQRQNQTYTRQNSLSKHDLLYNLNNFHSPLSMGNDSNSTTTLQNHKNNTQSMSFCPLQKQPEGFIYPDTPQTTVSSASSLDISLNNLTTTVEKPSKLKDDSDMLKQPVRSPVRLDIFMPENLLAKTISSPEIDQIINEVAQGKGEISIVKKSKRPQKRLQTKKPLAAQLVWEPNGSETVRKPLSPSNQEGQQRTSNVSSKTTFGEPNLQTTILLSNAAAALGQTIINQSSPEHNSADNGKGFDQSLSNNVAKPNQTSTTKINTPQSTVGSLSPLDISRTTTTSPVSSQLNSVNNLISWHNTPASSSSPKCSSTIITTTTEITSSGASVLNMSDDSWECSLLSYDDQERPMTEERPRGYVQILDFLMSGNDNFHPSIPPLPASLSTAQSSSINDILPSPLSEGSSFTGEKELNHEEIYQNYFPPNKSSSPSQTQENQVISSIPVINDSHNDSMLQENNHVETNQIISSKIQSKEQTSTPMNAQLNAKTSINKNSTHELSSKKPKLKSKQPQSHQGNPTKKSHQQSKSINKKSLKRLPKPSKQQNLVNHQSTKSSIQSKCSRCGKTQLVDITEHEFPKQRGLVFECVACGNNSLKSNVSADERKRRLAKVAADHLTKITCQFCQKNFHSHNDYLMHLRNDHQSNKPI